MNPPNTSNQDVPSIARAMGSARPLLKITISISVKAVSAPSKWL